MFVVNITFCSVILVLGHLELSFVPDDVEVRLLLAKEQWVAQPPVRLRRLFPSQPCPHIWVVGT